MNPKTYGTKRKRATDHNATSVPRTPARFTRTPTNVSVPGQSSLRSRITATMARSRTHLPLSRVQGFVTQEEADTMPEHANLYHHYQTARSHLLASIAERAALEKELDSTKAILTSSREDAECRATKLQQDLDSTQASFAVLQKAMSGLTAEPDESLARAARLQALLNGTTLIKEEVDDKASVLLLENQHLLTQNAESSASSTRLQSALDEAKERLGDLAAENARLRAVNEDLLVETTAMENHLTALQRAQDASNELWNAESARSSRLNARIMTLEGAL